MEKDNSNGRSGPNVTFWEWRKTWFVSHVTGRKGGTVGEAKLDFSYFYRSDAGGLLEDFLGLIENFYYLSGRYEIELAVGDSLMENSFSNSLAYLELDLPEPPEKAVRPPVQQVDPYSRFGPKQEISHIFRAPEKRPPEKLSYVFLALTLLPLVGFFVGLIRLGVNLKGFPSSAAPASFSALFHICIAAVLLLYVLFWVKLDLFTTLKALGLLGIFLVFVGHKTLSNLAKASGKIKSA